MDRALHKAVSQVMEAATNYHVGMMITHLDAGWYMVRDPTQKFRSGSHASNVADPNAEAAGAAARSKHPSTREPLPV
ncbi:hypothetical protein AB4Z38_23555 [Arthrobacter sp. 2RAF6]|uniref:hypothetical protein n=1 Tax=Arthrobacter sp. 2RAF6 TaxID=3233002 RepID=UPI003F906F82